MKKNVAIPKEFPNPNSRPDKWRKQVFKIEMMKILNGKSEENEDKWTEPNYLYKKNFKEMKSAAVVVSLSGEKNYKAVTNWMRKHMETYPETRDGFFVRFVDMLNDNKWYKVEVCGENEKGEKINWINYKITPYIFDVVDSIKKDSEKEIMESFTGEKVNNLVE